MSRRETTGATMSETPAARRRLLIVDDDPEFLESMQDLFEGLYDITAVDRADQALPVVMRDRPEVVLLDLDLGSDLSGFDVLAYLKQLEIGRAHV